MTTRATYELGTWFCVPLRNDGFARGVVTRIGDEGVTFGYFFGPRLEDCATEIPDDLKPEDRVLWGKFGDLGLINGEWPVIGVSDGWRAEDWPMPLMVRVDEAAGIAFASTYDDSIAFVSEERCDPSLAETHPYDRLMGYGSVEIRLTKLLG